MLIKKNLCEFVGNKASVFSLAQIVHRKLSWPYLSRIKTCSITRMMVFMSSTAPRLSSSLSWFISLSYRCQTWRVHVLIQTFSFVSFTTYSVYFLLGCVTSQGFLVSIHKENSSFFDPPSIFHVLFSPFSVSSLFLPFCLLLYCISLSGLKTLVILYHRAHTLLLFYFHQPCFGRMEQVGINGHVTNYSKSLYSH